MVVQDPLLDPAIIHENESQEQTNNFAEPMISTR